MLAFYGSISCDFNHPSQSTGFKIYAFYNSGTIKAELVDGARDNKSNVWLDPYHSAHLCSGNDI